MFIAITKTYFDPEIKDRISKMTEESATLVRSLKGFVSRRTHLATDGSHFMTYWEWQTKEDHEACMTHPGWAEFNREWGELTESGKLRFELKTYETIDALTI
ncbi:Antibiotic biosynthesis monooxygenase [Sulfidibacter corallicola]|uniref:Antibiotic biosynthesis monooxygenase n=1 Tax=Sulfidibacter corallicola TaxID=2818388 RepID=A0A8A4THD3_SULCO|nr:hypothetical protein [Sulfidibacter corallicola]QTD49043.1 antibiotic biosynthesis monooxygenase [Sulfidibacter corallicola]